ncbi:MAG: hypothetical protein CM15mP87_00300 [Candidatus Neomarinimicrobiota bacterium]|nr:MAG: hypothetical protein CM15mP87_00300 [Candidatus Neomarinimicrobiota bacterium]
MKIGDPCFARFTIQNGNGYFADPDGNGLFILWWWYHCQDSDPTLKDLIITNNSGDEGGGGEFCMRLQPTYRDAL